MGASSLIGPGISALSSAAGGKGGDGGGGGGGGQNPFDPFALAFANMENLTKIHGRYADLGLGGSTMESMDEAGANLQSLAEAQQLSAQGQQQANQNLTTGVNALGSLSNIANQANQTNQANQATSQTSQGIQDITGGGGGTGTSGPTFG